MIVWIVFQRKVYCIFKFRNAEEKIVLEENILEYSLFDTIDKQKNQGIIRETSLNYFGG